MNRNENVILIRAEDQASQTLMRIGDSMQAMTDRVATTIKTAVGLAATVAASKVMLSSANRVTEAYLEQKEAARSLTDANLEYSASMQDLTGVQDETINHAMHRAGVLGIEESAIEDVTTAALGLSQVTGQSLMSALMKTNEAIKGNANAWASYLPEIREVESEEEKLAIIQAAAVRGMEDRIKMTGEEAGAIARRKAAMEDLYAAIGRIIGPSVKAQDAITVLAKMSADAVNSMMDSIAAAADTGGSIVSQAMDFMFNASVAAMAGIETAVKNLDSVFELFSAGIEYDVLYWTRLFDDFGKNAARSVEWLKSNILNVWGDLGRATLSIFRNLGGNIGEVVAAIGQHIADMPRMIATGMSRIDIAKEFTRKLNEDVIFKGLLDGYKPLAQAFPEMIESAATEREAELLQRMAELGEKLGVSFNESFGSRMEWAKGMLDKFRQGMDLPEFNLKGMAGASEEDGVNKASRMGILESRLLTRGAGDPANEQIVANTKATADRLDKLNAAAEKLLDKWDEETRGEGKLKIEVVS